MLFVTIAVVVVVIAVVIVIAVVVAKVPWLQSAIISDTASKWCGW